MRKRERELVRAHKLLEKEFGKDENLREISIKLENARKKLNDIAREKGFT